jgi:hypothetical protein
MCLMLAACNSAFHTFDAFIKEQYICHALAFGICGPSIHMYAGQHSDKCSLHCRLCQVAGQSLSHVLLFRGCRLCLCTRNVYSLVLRLFLCIAFADYASYAKWHQRSLQNVGYQYCHLAGHYTE